MLNYLAHVSRDNARTPMQWDSSLYAGFSTCNPWISLSRSWRAVNAERELTDPDSVFWFYKKVLEYRKGNPDILNGSFELLWPEHEQIFAYMREYNGEKLLILCNFSSESVELPDIPCADSAQIVLANYPDAELSGSLRPYEGAAFRIFSF